VIEGGIGLGNHAQLHLEREGGREGGKGGGREGTEHLASEVERSDDQSRNDLNEETIADREELYGGGEGGRDGRRKGRRKGGLVGWRDSREGGRKGGRE